MSSCSLYHNRELPERSGHIELSAQIRWYHYYVGLGYKYGANHNCILGNKEYNCLCVEKEFIVDAVKEAGFSSVHMQSWGIESSGAKQYVTEKPGI